MSVIMIGVSVELRCSKIRKRKVALKKQKKEVLFRKRFAVVFYLFRMSGCICWYVFNIKIVFIYILFIIIKKILKIMYAYIFLL